jgi:thioredoxin reductase (NADPH)
MYDIIIIGGGPTGISVAIEAQSKGLSYIILEKGKLVNSIYNFPTNMTFFSTSLKLEIGDMPFISHNDKPTRLEALEYYRRLSIHYDLNVKYRFKVQKVTDKGGYYIINEDEDYKAKHIVVATGFYDHYRPMNVPGEDLAKVKHYFDDAHPYIGMNLLVVGAANSACDVALETWQKGANVTMIIRQSEIYPKVKYWIKPNIENRIKEGSIQAHFNSKVKEITQTKVSLDTPQGILEIDNDYVLAMTGYKPDFDFLESIGINIDSNNGSIPEFNKKTFESNVSNIYLAGVIQAGLNTSQLFIENTRDHGVIIVDDILKKMN